MSYKIIYGLDTGSIEDAAQVVVVDVPDEVQPDDLESWLAEHATEQDGSIIGYAEARGTLRLILENEITDAELRNRIIDSFTDAAVNSFN